MNFLKAQQELADLTMDTSTEWAAGGAKNKKAINKAYEQLFDTYKHFEKVKRHFVTEKTLQTFTNKI